MKISWIPLEDTQSKHRLGLTHIPGGVACSRDADLATLAEAGVSHVFCLVEADELDWAMDPSESLEERREAVHQHGMQFTHEPIVDYEAPSLPQAQRLTQQILNALEHGDVILHCWAGLGRAGTIAACVLIAKGKPAGEAITLVRWYRPGAIQSLEQETLIQTFDCSQ